MKYRNFIINVCWTLFALLLLMAVVFVGLWMAGTFIYAATM